MLAHVKCSIIQGLNNKHVAVPKPWGILEDTHLKMGYRYKIQVVPRPS